MNEDKLQEVILNWFSQNLIPVNDKIKKYGIWFIIGGLAVAFIGILILKGKKPNEPKRKNIDPGEEPGVE